MLHSRMTTKGQVTIPIKIRQSLGLSQGDKVVFIVEDSGVKIKPSKSVVEATFGALAGDQPSMSAEQERDAFERFVAEEVKN